MLSKIALATCTLAGLLQPVTADFWIYTEAAQVKNDDFSSVVQHGFAFFNGHPDCDDVEDHIFQASWSDVSGGRTGGVRCVGCDDEPTEIEFNNRMGHYTWYADRGGSLVDTDDKVVGNCHVHIGEDEFECAIPPLADMSSGTSLLFCTTDLNADEI